MEHAENWKRLGKGDLPTEDAAVGLGHIVPVSTYNKVFAALVCLTALTVWAATLHVGHTAHLAIAMFIAIIKASMVYGVFMHVLWEKKIIWIIVGDPMIILALMILGTTGDSSIKRDVIPASQKVTYLEGKAFGVNDEFLVPAPKTEEAHH